LGEGGAGSHSTHFNTKHIEDKGKIHRLSPVVDNYHFKVPFCCSFFQHRTDDKL
jgi:hypothetical protein